MWNTQCNAVSQSLNFVILSGCAFRLHFLPTPLPNFSEINLYVKSSALSRVHHFSLNGASKDLAIKARYFLLYESVQLTVDYLLKPPSLYLIVKILFPQETGVQATNENTFRATTMRNNTLLLCHFLFWLKITLKL